MGVHVFIGAGPANLDRALKIRKQDPDAKLVFLDKRLTVHTPIDSQDSYSAYIKRDTARANIFRFPLSDKEKIIDAGVNRDYFDSVSTERDFSEQEGFQHGDTQVFGSERFTQIQIRDLQNLYLSALEGKNTLFIDTEVDINNFHKVTEESDVKEFILKDINAEYVRLIHLAGSTEEAFQRLQDIQEEYKQLIDFLSDNDDVTYHVAAGALREGATRDESTTPDSIIYPARSEEPHFSDASPDLSAMPVTAMHGTTTFQLPEDFKTEEFVHKTKSLDDTAWKATLAEHGWQLHRPPRIRLFYANDTLYVGAEVPASFAKLLDEHGRPTEAYKQKQEAYTRAIAKLMLPDFAETIQDLPANKKGVNAPTFFLTSRGETGDVLNISKDKATVISHGDRRYLPHYQTGSGFLTATQQNDLYVNIYLKDDFVDLFKWARDNGHVEHSLKEVYGKYYRAVKDTPEIKQLSGLRNFFARRAAIRQATLKMFKADLYTYTTHQILDANKEKVNKYFTQLQSQALSLLSEDDNFKDLIAAYNRNFVDSMHVASNFKPRQDQEEGLNPDSEINMSLRPIVIMEMLLHGKDEFLLETLPKLINVDLSDINLDNPDDVDKLHKLRDSFTDGYMKYVKCSEVFQNLAHEKQQELLNQLVQHRNNPEMVRKAIADVVGICPSHPKEVEDFRTVLLQQSPTLFQCLEVFQNLSESEQEAFTRELIKHENEPQMLKMAIGKLANINPSKVKLIEAEIIRVNLMDSNPVFKYAFDMKNGQLEVNDPKLNAEKILETFNKHPELAKTSSGFSIFRLTGIHASKIEQFKSELQDIIKNSNDPDSVKQEKLSSAILKFQKELIDGKSQRTIKVLTEAVAEATKGLEHGVEESKDQVMRNS